MSDGESKYTEAVFEGFGPFVTPLMAEYVSIQLPAEEAGYLLVEFRLEDGPPVLVPIANHAAERLAMVLSTVPSVREANKPKH